MKRSVTKMTGLNIYRDGGSLSVSFCMDEACDKLDEKADTTYRLFFPVKNSPAFDPALTTFGFSEPRLDTYLKVYGWYPTEGSPASVETKPHYSNGGIKGYSVDATSKWETQIISVEISWTEARALLESMRPYLSGYVIGNAWIFNTMLEAAATDGQLVSRHKPFKQVTLMPPDKKKKIFNMIAFFGIALQFILSLAYLQETGKGTPPFYAFAGFFIFVTAMLSRVFFIRCPICEGNIGAEDFTIAVRVKRVITRMAASVNRFYHRIFMAPKNKERGAQVYMSPTRHFAVPKNIKYCPYCGGSLSVQ
jgi:hypothetical protein